MKIILSTREILAFKQLKKKSDDIATAVAHELGVDPQVTSLIDKIKDKKFVKLSIDLSGFVLEIPEELVTEYCNLSTKMADVLMKIYSPIFPVIKAAIAACAQIQSICKDVEDPTTGIGKEAKEIDTNLNNFSEKWFID